MRKFKKFETLIRVIQESLKDNPNTEITFNERPENKSGNKRELDILIRSTIQGFSIGILIECKDWSKKIPVGEIEKFHSKCLRLKDINKRVFVSRKGFQKDAFDAAEDFNIDLYLFEDINQEKIFDWITINDFSSYRTERLVKLNQIKGKRFGKFENTFNEPTIVTAFDHFVPLKKFLYNYVTAKIPGKIIILNNDSTYELETLTVHFKLPMNGVFYIVENIVYDLSEMDISIVHKMTKRPTTIENNIYKNVANSVEIKVSSIINEDNEIYSFVNSNENDLINLVVGESDKPVSKIAELNPKIEGTNSGVQITREAILIRNYKS